MIASIDWVTLHQKFGFIVVIAAVVGALVALISLVTPLVGLALKIYLRILLLAVAVQILLGAALYLMGNRPVHELHYLYGAGMAVTLGVTFAVSRRTPWPVSKLPLVVGAIVAVVFSVLTLTSG
jgi:Na+-transporting NADH:ubiquinone oxidoreductase subunit NqrE